MRDTSLPRWLHPTEGATHELDLADSRNRRCGHVDVCARGSHPEAAHEAGSKIAAWVLIIILLPVVGSIAYFVVNAGGGGEAAPRDPTVGPIP